METVSLTSQLVWSLAAVFGVIGCIHLIGPRFLCESFEKWNYGSRLRFAAGILQIGVAMMLVDSELRLWGIGLAALFMFAAVITLLHHEQYAYAVPSMVLMLALVPATLSVPADPQIRFAPVVETAAQPQPTTVASNALGDA